ncbi:MAG: hypothetical protein HDS99_00555 [Bacteroidales bacterium]|nr:hypothetical protein [Bacteroidales bacterium]
MIKIFIESKNSQTPEYNFLETILRVFGYNSQPSVIVPLNGKDTLDLARNQFIQNTVEGGTNLIIFDADTAINGGGYNIRRQEIETKLRDLHIQADIFLWPDNCNDGDFETLLESIARKDLHERFFGCFNDYELCLGDEYLCPNRKGKLHTYITSMKLTNKQRNKIGAGHWLFENKDLWDLDSVNLTALKKFLSKYL